MDYADDIPDDWTPLEAVEVVKCLDAEGNVALVSRATSGVTAWEALGMLIAAADGNRDELRADFIADE